MNPAVAARGASDPEPSWHANPGPPPVPTTRATTVSAGSTEAVPRAGRPVRRFAGPAVVYCFSDTSGRSASGYSLGVAPPAVLVEPDSPEPLGRPSLSWRYAEASTA